LKLKTSGVVILIGSASTLSDPRKGSDLAIEILLLLKKKLTAELTIISIGPDGTYPKELDVKNLGFISSDSELSLIYSCADFSFLSSRIDNLPQFMTESLACGTPVVAFNKGGASDVLTDPNLGGFISMESLPAAVNEFAEIIKQRSYFDANTISKIVQDKWSSARLVKEYEEFLSF
jgi:glycosyltransferase involved in cell wall biosynthesis